MNDKPWYSGLDIKAIDFVRGMSAVDFSYTRYSYSGDIYHKRDRWGLGNSVFATKILHIAGAEDLQTHREHLASAIRWFAAEDGLIYDPLITRQTWKDRARYLLNAKLHSRDVQEVRRAETRQAFAAMRILHEDLPSPFMHIPYTPEGIDLYLQALDWSKPWSAGSHFSHLLFFLRSNAMLFDYKTSESQGLIDHAVGWVNQMQCSEDGTWYSGEHVSLQQKINGAMKVLTGFEAAGVTSLMYAREMIDTALTAANDEEACSNFNVVYVLYNACQHQPEYRHDEVVKFLEDRLSLYSKFYYPELGGFSFHHRKANDVYYGKLVSLGKDEPDIHGTTLFMWGMSLISKMMDTGLQLNVPIT